MTEVQASARLAVKLEAVLRGALEVVLAGGQRPPRAQPLLDLPVVRIVFQVKRVNVAIFKVAHNNFVVERHLAVTAVTGERAVGKPCPLVPSLCGGIVHPCGVGRGEDQHVKAVTVLLVCVPNGVRQVRVLLDLPLDGVGRDSLACVAVGPVDDALTTAVTAKPEQAVVHLGNGVGGSAAQLVKRAGNALKREVQRSSVRPDFDRVGSKGPDFAEVGNYGHQAVRRSFSAGKLQRINGCAVQNGSHPHLLAVRLVEHKVAVQVGHSHSAWEVRVRDGAKCVCGGVVDVAGAVGCNEQLSAVVSHADGTSTTYTTNQCGSVGIVNLEQLAARHHKARTIVRGECPQSTDWTIADCVEQVQAGSAVQKRRLFARFRHNLGKQIDHPGIRSVDTAGHIAGAKDRGLHQ